MNTLKGKITNIKTEGKLSLVEVHLMGFYTLTSILIETPETATYLREGTEVKALFKETDVVIAYSRPRISLENCLPCIITDIERGVLLSRITLEFERLYTFTALITTSVVDEIELEVGKGVKALMKPDDIMLAE